MSIGWVFLPTVGLGKLCVKNQGLLASCDLGIGLHSFDNGINRYNIQMQILFHSDKQRAISDILLTLLG